MYCSSTTLPGTCLLLQQVSGRTGTRFVGSGIRTGGRCTGAATTTFDHLVQRQVQQVVLPTFAAGHENLAGVAEDFLHGVQVQTLAGHFRSLAVLGDQLGETICLTLGAGDHFIAVTVGIFKDALGLTTGFRHNAVGIGFSLVARTLLVFTGTDHVVKGFLHFTRCRCALYVHLSDGNTSAIGIEEPLQALLDFAGHQFTTFGQHLVHGGGTHHVAQGTFGCVLQTDFRLINVQHEVLQVADLVLHGQRHFDDVLVFGQHLALLGVRTLTRHVLHVLLVDRREIDVQAWPDSLVVLAEAQHHGLLLLVHHVDRAVQPYGREHDKTQAQQAIATALACATAVVTTTFFSTTEQPIQAFLQLSEGLVEIRWPLAVAVIAALTTPRILIIRVATRLIPSHSALHLIKQRRTHGAPTNATECLLLRHNRFLRLLLQSVLFDKLCRYNTLSADQPIEFRAWQSNGQQADTFFVVFFFLYSAQLEKLCTQSSKTLRQAQGADEQIAAEQFGNGLFQQLQATAISRRQPDPLGLAVLVALDLWLNAFKQIEFVIDLEDRQVLGTNLAQHHHDLFNLQHAIRFGRIDHVQQQVGIARLFERRPKCLDELVGQVTNETHGIGQHNRPQVVDVQTPQGRVEGGEQLVGRVHIRLGHVIEQRGFAGVGVAHQRNRRDIRTGTATSRLLALAAHFFQAALDLAQANPQQTPVGFQLGFTRATHADTATLTLKVSPAANQAGAHVIKLGQFDLELAFMGTGALGENVENQAGTVDHATLENTFEVTFLTGREGVIEDHQIGFFGMNQVAQFLDLAAANQVFGGWPMTRYVKKRNGLGAGRICQLLKLLRIFARLRVLSIQVNEDYSLTTTVALKEQRRLLSGVTWLSVTLFITCCARQTDWTNWNDCRDSVLVNHLADGVFQQDNELVERLDRTLQLDAVDQIDGNPNFLFT
ncbi:hypothetical protein ALP29_05226 [Pseudomonas syringae pv. avii]|uniref:Uncharacterized protein n=1 Tax=Pseudomonas syringae pv. avii TaxID=663959 RepID=A0A3M5U3L4_PSESX|nr:hypothetical protein ALP29_05226 [Pseudomonas syringae pv. avii]